jgi:diacylglycerol kinase (ATP)
MQSIGHHWVLGVRVSSKKTSPCAACGGISPCNGMFSCSRLGCSARLHSTPDLCAGGRGGSPPGLEGKSPDDSSPERRAPAKAALATGPCPGAIRLGSPVLALTNRRSGSGQGKRLVRTLRRLLGVECVFDLVDSGGPSAGIELMMRRFGPTGFRIVVCGGDGTFSWVMGHLATLPVPRPPMATLPLGTGNDLARQLGWGGGYTGEPVGPILDEIAAARPVAFDRWTVHWRHLDAASGERARVGERSSMVNYFSIGFDASTALGFHELRERRPGLFFARVVNKAMYGIFGCREMITARSVATAVELRIDGVPCEIPRSAKALVLLNIGSFASGTDPWGSRRRGDRSAPEARIDDGALEVVALPGPLHFGLMTVSQAAGVNRMHATRLGQGTRVDIVIRGAAGRGLSAQVDGEPRRVPEGTHIAIGFENRVTMLASPEVADRIAAPGLSTAPTMLRSPSQADHLGLRRESHESDEDDIGDATISGNNGNISNTPAGGSDAEGLQQQQQQQQQQPGVVESAR